MARADSSAVQEVRRFNRFYTRQIGVLQEGLLRTDFPLTEVRVIFEIAQRPGVTAAELVRELGLDAGYLSRLLRNLKRRRLILSSASASDARQLLLRLTRAGQRIFSILDWRSSAEVTAMLKRLDSGAKRRLLGAMGTIEKLLAPRSDTAALAYILRPPRSGDMGWIVHRHGKLYGEEYGWDERFEALCARITADFIENLDSRRERCWVAERDGEFAGCVFLVKSSAGVAKLRLLLVEPSARGLGIGQRLVEECVVFARQSGYQKIMLWTNSVLQAARHIYKAVGFRVVKKERHHSFGHALVAETWELKLQRARRDE